MLINSAAKSLLAACRYNGRSCTTGFPSVPKDIHLPTRLTEKSRGTPDAGRLRLADSDPDWLRRAETLPFPAVDLFSLPNQLVVTSLNPRHLRPPIKPPASAGFFATASHFSAIGWYSGLNVHRFSTQSSCVSFLSDTSHLALASSLCCLYRWPIPSRSRSSSSKDGISEARLLRQARRRESLIHRTRDRQRRWTCD